MSYGNNRGASVLRQKRLHHSGLTFMHRRTRMSGKDLGNGVTGRTLRFTWTDGPTKGAVHEHVFHSDGTVEWHEAGKEQPAAKGGADRPRFSDDPAAPNVRLVSYLSKSGFTLTVALNGDTGKITGIASNDKTWVPVHGTFEVTG